MKLIIDQRTLRAAVDKAALFTVRNSTMLPGQDLITISANGKLQFHAGLKDASATIIVPLASYVPCDEATHTPARGETKTIEDGHAALNAELFQKVAQSLREGGEVTIETSDVTHRAQLFMGANLVAQMKIEEQITRDETTVAADARSFLIDAVKLRAIAAKCAPFVGNDPYKPALQGVAFEYDGTTLTATATDSYTLASIAMPMLAGPAGAHAEPFAFVVPVALLKNAAHVLDGVVTIRFTATAIQFESDYVSVCGELTDAQYPNWRAVVPHEHERTLTADRTELIGSIARLAIFANHATAQISLHLTDVREYQHDGIHLDALTLHAENYDAGNEATEYAHADVVNAGAAGTLIFGCNARLLTRVLLALETEVVAAQFVTPTRPALFIETTELGMEALYLLMPVRLATPHNMRETPLAGTPLAEQHTDMVDHERSVDLYVDPCEEETDEEHALAEAEDDEYAMQAAEDESDA